LPDISFKIARTSARRSSFSMNLVPCILPLFQSNKTSRRKSYQVRAHDAGLLSRCFSPWILLFHSGYVAWHCRQFERTGHVLRISERISSQS
jgi:hypothetical protein